MPSRSTRTPRKPSRRPRSAPRRTPKRNDAALGAHAHLATDRLVNAYLHYGDRNEFNDLPIHTVHLRREHGRWSLAKGDAALRMVHQQVSEREAATVVAAVRRLLAGESITVSPRLALTWATVRGASRGIQFASLDALSRFADEAIIANKMNRAPSAKGNRSFFLRVGSRVKAPGLGAGTIVATDNPDAWAESFVFGGRRPSQAEVRRVLAKTPPTRLGIDGKSPVRWASGRVTWIDDRTLAKTNGAAAATDVMDAPSDVDASTLARVSVAVAGALLAAAMGQRAVPPESMQAGHARSYKAALAALDTAERTLGAAEAALDHPNGHVIAALQALESEARTVAYEAAQNPWPGAAQAAVSAAGDAAEAVLYSVRSNKRTDRAWWSTWSATCNAVERATNMRGLNLVSVIERVSSSRTLLTALNAHVHLPYRHLTKQNTMVLGADGPYDLAPETLAVDAPFFRRVTLSTADSWAAPHVRGRVHNTAREFERVSMNAAMQDTLRSTARSLGAHKRGVVYVQEPGATRGGDRWARVRKV